MNQKIEDLKILLKTDRRAWAIIGVLIVGMIVWTLTAPPPVRHSKRMQSNVGKASNPAGEGAEAVSDLIVAFRNDIDLAKKERLAMYDVLQRTSTDLKEHKERVTGIFEALVDRFDQISEEVDGLTVAFKTQVDNPPNSLDEKILSADELEPIGFDAPVIAPPPVEPQPLRVSVIAPGDSVQLKLMTGVNAPTDGTPYPVVFSLASPIEGPDGSSLDLGEARVIAAAQGSEADGRALFRLTQLAIRHPNGRRSVIEIDGWIVGEDGVRGMKGRLIDKLGRLIAATAVVSGVAALGERIDDSTQDVVRIGGSGFGVSGEDMDYAAASAITDASNRLGSILLNRYESLVPVVEVLSGREVAAIFSKPAEIEIIDNADLAFIPDAGL